MRVMTSHGSVGCHARFRPHGGGLHLVAFGGVEIFGSWGIRTPGFLVARSKLESVATVVAMEGGQLNDGI